MLLDRNMRSCTLLLLLCAGCGGNGTVPVNGTVTLNGEPLANANVIFHSPEVGRPAVARTDANGSFALSSFGEADGALPGEYTVTIVALAEMPTTFANIDPMQDLDGHIAEGEEERLSTQDKPQVVEGADGAPRMEMAAGQPSKKHESLIHENYTSVSKSPLKVSIPSYGPVELKLTEDGT